MSTIRVLSVIYVISFFLHFVWEMWQIPFYADMLNADHWSAVIVCSRATLGDGVIAIIAYMMSALTAHNITWLHRPTRRVWVIYIGSGLLITMLLEYFSTRVFYRWQYSASMPVIPGIHIGLVPFLQWIIIPPITIVVSRIFLVGLDRH